jgi:BirA family biotin operon repressor/biotin-[acetyl-CoA-carboxylase] ligase
MIDLALLKILSDGKFHSGTFLGNELSMSRSAIWKQMKDLQEHGVEVYSVRGRGYRLPNGLDLLDQAKIAKGLSADSKKQIQHIELQTITDSTNLMALRNINEQRHGALYLTEYQNAGRGRRGRTWVGGLASNLYFSLIWRFSGGAAALEGLSLLVGLSVVQGLAKLGVNNTQLKWPNDLLHQGKKFAGILLEMQGDASGDISVVIGVGLNVAMKADHLSSQIEQPWTDLQAICDRPIDRNKLLTTVINQLIGNLHLFTEQRFMPFKALWEQYHVYQDSYVKLLMGDKEIEGICRGVNEQGALVLERFGKLEVYHGGEISLRPITES